MIQVELDIFSGRSNPIWELNSMQTKQFLERLEANKALVKPILDTAPVLGYRGFVIYISNQYQKQMQDLGLPMSFRVSSEATTSLSTSAPSWLLSTAQHHVSLQDEVQEVAYSSIINPAIPIFDQETGIVVSGEELAESFQTCGRGPGQCCGSNYLTSSTDLSFWNANNTHRQNNNCYNFAANKRTNTFAQPGRQGGQIFSSYTCSSVSDAVRRDGWKDNCVTTNNLNIFLVIWPNVDFHFYRLCSSGRWCHKPGSTNATNRDNSGNYITNPATCNRGSYTSCGEYFFANNSTISVN